jgi:hypothetical protein
VIVAAEAGSIHISSASAEHLPITDQFKEGAWSDPLSRNQLGATIVDLSSE